MDVVKEGDDVGRRVDDDPMLSSDLEDDFSLDAVLERESEKKIVEGDVVVVSFEDTWYIGKVKRFVNGEPEVVFMHKQRGGKFVWVDRDVSVADVRQIIKRKVRASKKKQQKRLTTVDKSMIDACEKLYRVYADKYLLFMFIVVVL